MASEPRDYPDYVFVAYDEDFSAQTYDIAVSLEPGNLVGRPVKYVRHDLNTRPAPAATDTGLETLAHMAKSRMGWVPAPHWSGEAVCLRSQAEELLAAERAEKEIAERNRDAARDNFLTMQKSAAKLLERAEKAEAELAAEQEKALFLKTAMEIAQTHCGLKDKTIDSLEADNAALIHDLNRIKDHETELVNDNVAKDARIKEAEAGRDRVRRIFKRNTRLRFEAENRSEILAAEVTALRETLIGEQSHRLALEAKLEAAEKALEPFVSFFNEAMKGFTEGYAERTPPDKPVLGWNNAYLLMRHFIEARAVLGGKP